MSRSRFLLIIAFLLLGNGLMAQGVTDDQVILGQSCALKGPAAALGEGMNGGLQLYFDAVNAKGGVKGRKIELKSVNDGYEPEKCEVATKMLIEKADAFALIGGVGTPTAKVALPIAAAAKVPFIAPLTGAEFLRNPHQATVLNMRASYYQEMERLAAMLVDEAGLKSIACFYQDDAYGEAGLAGIVKALEKRGLKLAATGTYKRNTIAIATGLDALAPAKPDAVVMVGAYKACAAFIKAAKARPETRDCVFCNISFVGTKALLAELGDAAQGCVVSQVVPFPWDRSVPIVAEYQDAMTQAGKSTEFDFVSLEGFMAGKLFCQLLERVEGSPTREAFLATAAATTELDLGGVKLSYGADDNQGMDQVYLTIFDDGKVLPLESGSTLARAAK
ncbi:MAG: ABC transporter substrate-binding protein [Planctomycetes bacterium]|nr:ABC transporter substrate-binding protein [Planctomycetota bacterium]